MDTTICHTCKERHYQEFFAEHCDKYCEPIKRDERKCRTCKVTLVYWWFVTDIDELKIISNDWYRPTKY
jgi:hypothetical protein